MDLKELYDGLKLNSINDYSYILTGYCGNSSFLTTIADIVNDIKTKNKQCVFVCDPVMGDNGKYYTPKDMMPVYRDVIVPIADILTPNAFELGELTGIKINCENDCFNAIDDLHKKGVSIVVVTSGVTDLEQDDDVLHCYASVQTSIMQKTQYRFTFPRLKGAYVGTGDVFTSLLVAWIDEVGDLAESVRNVIGSMQSLIKTTYDYAIDNASENTTAKCELKLIQSRKYLLFPPDLTNIHVDKING